jgi:hypothetical protein
MKMVRPWRSVSAFWLGNWTLFSGDRTHAHKPIATGNTETPFACRIRTSSDRPNRKKQLARQMAAILLHCRGDREKHGPRRSTGLPQPRQPSPLGPASLAAPSSN